MTDVVLSIAPNPKRTNSGAAHRYALYYVGGTEESLLARGLLKNDLSWDRKQGHVTWGPGEPAEPPPRPATPPPGPAQTRSVSRAVPRPSPEASAVAEDPRAPAVGLTLPAASVELVSPPADKPAAYWRGTVRVTAEAEAGSQGRSWTVRAHLPDGRVLRRTERSDRLATLVAAAAALHGVDTDDWKTEEQQP